MLSGTDTWRQRTDCTGRFACRKRRMIIAYYSGTLARDGGSMTIMAARQTAGNRNARSAYRKLRRGTDNIEPANPKNGSVR